MVKIISRVLIFLNLFLFFLISPMDKCGRLQCFIYSQQQAQKCIQRIKNSMVSLEALLISKSQYETILLTMESERSFFIESDALKRFYFDYLQMNIYLQQQCIKNIEDDIIFLNERLRHILPFYMKIQLDLVERGQWQEINHSIQTNSAVSENSRLEQLLHYQKMANQSQEDEESEVKAPQQSVFTSPEEEVYINDYFSYDNYLRLINNLPQ